jgi:hypothetical protein
MLPPAAITGSDVPGCGRPIGAAKLLLALEFIRFQNRSFAAARPSSFNRGRAKTGRAGGFAQEFGEHIHDRSHAMRLGRRPLFGHQGNTPAPLRPAAAVCLLLALAAALLACNPTIAAICG